MTYVEVFFSGGEGVAVDDELAVLVWVKSSTFHDQRMQTLTRQTS